MNIYDNYLSTIREAVGRDKRNKSLTKGFSHFDGGLNVSLDMKTFLERKIDMTPLASLQNVISSAGLKPNLNQKLGEHPDFRHLKTTNQKENHYIISVFIDIKDSTDLFREYEPETILVITNTIQLAAIHTCVAFGGYIQRLQGDGVFVYFGGKGIDKKDATLKAITACSMFTYFVKNDLKKIFDHDGIEDIATKIGIDFGDDDKVIWAKAGVGECSEITTYSLHTNLASKMQSWAKPNGVIIGDYVRERISLTDDFFSPVTDSYGNVSKRYIFEDRKNGFYYAQYDFNWAKYLKSIPYLKEDPSGLFTKSKDEIDGERLEKLRETAGLITAGKAFTNTSGNISRESGVKNQPHRFHYEG